MPPERTVDGWTTSTPPRVIRSSNSKRVVNPQSPAAMRVSTAPASRAYPSRLSAGSGASTR
jgi:hypothetical protein